MSPFFKLSHSKRLMTDFILALGGFESNKINYGINDSEYIHIDCQILKTKL